MLRRAAEVEHKSLTDFILYSACQAGIRTMLTHPIDSEAAGLYPRFGIIAYPLHARQLLQRLKDATRWSPKQQARSIDEPACIRIHRHEQGLAPARKRVTL